MRTISHVLESLGVQRSKKAIHDWVQKADFQLESGRSPNQIVLDKTVIRINDQQFWLYAAAAPQTNHLLHVQLYSTRTTALTEMFLRELRKNTMAMALNTSKQRLADLTSDFRCVPTEIGTLSNEVFEN